MFCLSQTEGITKIKRRDCLAVFSRDTMASCAAVPVISCSPSEETTVFKCVLSGNSGKGRELL